MEKGKQAQTVMQTEKARQTQTVIQAEMVRQVQARRSINVTMPKKVFFSKDPIHYIVKNDFYITITGDVSVSSRGYELDDENMEGQCEGSCLEKTCKMRDPVEETCMEQKCREVVCAVQDVMQKQIRKGETYPTIYIKGFEQLFDDEITRHDQMDAFFKMFHVNGNKDWEISYGKFRDTEEDCVVITTSALSLKPNFSIGFQLSDRCAFTNRLEDTSPIALDIYVDDFDSFFADLDSRIQYTLSLERGYAVYIERFGAYMTSDPDTAVTAVHKGETCNISWRIEQNEKASAFLYDENGAVVANLPPYTASIDRNRKFMLLAYNDYCSVQKFLTVHRTLWKKTETALTGFPKTDKEGRFKIYQNYKSSYFLYVHPQLYISRDCVTWEVYAENTGEISGYTFYSSAYSENKFCVCYLDDNKIIYCEMDWDSKKWSRYIIARAGLSGVYALLSDPETTRIVVFTKDGIGIYELKGGKLINGEYIDGPQDAELLAVDALADGRRSYVTVACNNGRVYFYDLDDDFNNNIFECSGMPDDNIWLVKSNAVYILLNGYVLEVNDREKFMDMHYFPEFTKDTRPVIGALDKETIRGIFQNKECAESWNYHF